MKFGLLALTFLCSFGSLAQTEVLVAIFNRKIIVSGGDTIIIPDTISENFSGKHFIFDFLENDSLGFQIKGRLKIKRDTAYYYRNPGQKHYIVDLTYRVKETKAGMYTHTGKVIEDSFLVSSRPTGAISGVRVSQLFLSYSETQGPMPRNREVTLEFDMLIYARYIRGEHYKVVIHWPDNTHKVFR